MLLVSGFYATDYWFPPCRRQTFTFVIWPVILCSSFDILLTFSAKSR